ncbi:unnamed protein product [Eruca vesicaria subsp. sativa]|uniref:Uncharacterized protein n=1 Tax=Eruca vesicaria subsp. sativa TaxID=29727 RepID=A0ABC8J2F4_ERUVS|nr:unnamed protein product [Eruca vesicaria subsp. sativa]
MNHINQQWLKRFPFKNATIALTMVNVLIFLFLLRGFFTSSSSSSSSSTRIISARLRYIKEAREIRLAMQPLELIKRVKEIQQEPFIRDETEQQKDVKLNTPDDLSKRVKAFFPTNEALSLKALEEWRKRKMERARQRKVEKTGGAFSSKYGRGYKDHDYATVYSHGHVPDTHAGEHKAGGGTTMAV